MKRNILTIISSVMAIIALCSILFVYGCVKPDNETSTVSEIELKTEEPTVLETEEIPTNEDVTVLDGTAVDAD